MGFSFFPKTPKFFDLFIKQNEFIQQASISLLSLFSDFTGIAEKCFIIANLESQGNEISDEITKQLSLSFITPIDREDIHAINISQENLLNSIKAISSRVSLYQSDGINRTSIDLIENLKEIINETTDMFAKIQMKKAADEHHTKIKNIKYQSDLLLLVALGELYETEIKLPVQITYILIWTQIYDRIEQAISAAEILCHVLEGVSLKNA
jgi:hypothetical protein